MNILREDPTSIIPSIDDYCLSFYEQTDPGFEYCVTSFEPAGKIEESPELSSIMENLCNGSGLLEDGILNQ